MQPTRKKQISVFKNLIDPRTFYNVNKTLFFNILFVLIVSFCSEIINEKIWPSSPPPVVPFEAVVMNKTFISPNSCVSAFSWFPSAVNASKGQLIYYLFHLFHQDLSRRPGKPSSGLVKRVQVIFYFTSVVFLVISSRQPIYDSRSKHFIFVSLAEPHQLRPFDNINEAFSLFSFRQII